METTDSAELSIQGHQLSPQFLNRVALHLKTEPFSRGDELVKGTIRVRTFDGFEFAYVVSRDWDRLVLTIGSVEPVVPQDHSARAMRLLDLVALFRGVTGL